MTESKNENDHFDLDHFDHIFLVSLLTLGTAHANMAPPPINRSLDHILARLFTLGIAYEKSIVLRSFWSFWSFGQNRFSNVKIRHYNINIIYIIVSK